MKKVKMSFTDLSDMRIYYSNSDRVKNKNGVKGTRFVLTSPLSDEQKAKIKAYKNT